MKTEKFVCVHIGDIHWGAMDPKILFKELKEIFVSYIQKHNKEIDMITFCGDYWDSKIPLTDQVSITGIKFFNLICQYCNSHDIDLRVIKGTKTHDFNQLDNFKYLEKQYSNLKIINTVSEEDYQGVKILYVPEEYMNDQVSYYEEYKNKKYDMMIGHGTWDVFAFDNQIIESERYIKGSPVFNYKEWENVIKYKIVFGHIHAHNIHKKLEYTGSFSRWIFGEEKPKGFLVTKLDLENERIETEFIENTLAQKYDTINMSDILEDDDNIEDVVKRISKLTKDNKKIKIKIDENLDTEDLNILKESSTNVKFEMKSVREQIKEDVIEEHDFLKYDLNKNLQLYIKETYNTDISEEEIAEILADSKEE